MNSDADDAGSQTVTTDRQHGVEDELVQAVVGPLYVDDSPGVSQTAAWPQELRETPAG